MKKPIHFSRIIAICLLISLIFASCDLAGPKVNETVTITFLSDEILYVRNINKGTNVGIPNNPTKQGYTFGGWYRNETCTDCWDFSDPVNIDMTLWAKWTPNSYTITYDYKSSQGTSTTQANYNTLLGEPATPQANGTKIFSGWYKDQSYNYRWDFETDKVTGDMTLYVQWLNDPVRIAFDAQGGSLVREVVGEKGSKLTKPADPSKDGYAFSGWYKNSELTSPWNFDTDTLNSDTTLYAKWTELFLSNIRSYRQASVDDLQIITEDVFDLPDFDDPDFMTFIMTTFNQAFGNTIQSIEEVMKGNASITTKRSISSTFKLSIEDENLYIINDDDDSTLLEMSLDHFDLEMTASANKLLSLLDTVMTAASAPTLEEMAEFFLKGRFGLSTFLRSLSDDVDTAVGLLIDTGIDKISYRIPTANNPLWINGDVYASVQASIATNSISDGAETYRKGIVISFSMKPIAGTKLSNIVPALKALQEIEDMDQIDTLLEQAFAAIWGSFDEADTYFSLSITDGTTTKELKNSGLIKYIIGIVNSMPNNDE